jgi:hypothetical protein
MKFNVAVTTLSRLPSGARRKAIGEAGIRELPPPSLGARHISGDTQSIRNAAMVRFRGSYIAEIQSLPTDEIRTEQLVPLQCR